MGVIWQPQDISSGTVTFQPGQRYALLASVGSGTSLPTIQNYVQGKGFQVTYLCEIVAGSAGGCAKRDEYDVDAWLAQITAKPRSGERWVYAEGNFTGSAPWAVPVTDSFPKTLVVTYAISVAFEAVQSNTTSPTGQPIAEEPVTPPSAPASTGWVVAGVATAAALAGLFWWTRR